MVSGRHTGAAMPGAHRLYGMRARALRSSAHQAAIARHLQYKLLDVAVIVERLREQHRREH